MFFVNNDWIAGKDLKQRDLLFAYSGYKVAIDSIYTFRSYSATAVYNLEADGNYNYYVSTSVVLVHNQCSQNIISLAKKFDLNANSKTTKSIMENLDMTALDFISKFRQGSIKNELPSEYLNKSVKEVLKVKNSTARKLLIDGRFLK
jgi:hypothetical protein